MKYPVEEYEETEFYSCDEEESHHKQKIVKCRKPHICATCQKKIKAGENALRETAFLDGPVSCYTCIDCCDKWLDEMSEEDPDV